MLIFALIEKLKPIHKSTHIYKPHLANCGTKECAFRQPKKKFNFFRNPSVFNFFATHNRHNISCIGAAKTFTHSDSTETVDRRLDCNSTYPKGGVKCSEDNFPDKKSGQVVVNGNFVFTIKFSGKNPDLLLAPNRLNHEVAVKLVPIKD